MTTINIIGAGHLGQALGVLFQRSGIQVSGVCNRTMKSSGDAVEVIGSGEAVGSLSELPRADVYLIGTGDDAIGPTCEALATEVDLTGSIVFHCSGSMPSSLLGAAVAAGASVASIHPIRSFANVKNAIDSFDGTFCGTEGDEKALSVLEPMFSAIGGRPVHIDPSQKTLYHAALVFAVNYFVVLVDVGLRCYEKAGVPQDLALQLLKPIVTGAAENATSFGPVGALSGPVARGDVGVVERQLEALKEWDPKLVSLYAALGNQAISVSAQAGNAADADLAALHQLFAATP